MKIPMLISLSGPKESGKNTLADYLSKKYGYKQVAWADKLKEEVSILIHHWTFYCFNEGEFDHIPLFIQDLLYETSKEYKTTGYFHNEDVLGYIYSKPYSFMLRKLLQQYGTEYRRAQDQSYWLKQMQFEPNTKYVITDTRFQNEVDLALLFNALTVQINPANFPAKETDNHSSEQFKLKGIRTYIGNFYGSPEVMYSTIDSFITDQSRGKQGIQLIDWGPTS